MKKKNQNMKKHKHARICAACGEPVIEDDLLCESCQARDDRHRDLEEYNEDT